MNRREALCTLAGAATLAPLGRLVASRAETPTPSTILPPAMHPNPERLCLHSGVGYRHPTPFSAYVTQLPDTVVLGHIGRPDDSPYQEASPLIEWSSQEIWDIPHGHMTQAVLWL